MDDTGRIPAFFRWFDDTVSSDARPWRFGTAMFDEAFPRKWDANFLRVERPLDGATAAELAAEADRLQAHLGHREIVFEDDAEGARVAAGFVELGWESDRMVTMVLARGADREPLLVEVAEASYDDVRALMVETGLQAIPELSREDAEMLADYNRVMGERIGARYLLARMDGEPAGYCQLFQRGDVAMVEDVNTLERFRGRGAARAFIGAAIETAREAGAGLIFLIADDSDWPKHLYAKLGFDEVGHFREFRKPPPRPASR